MTTTADTALVPNCYKLALQEARSQAAPRLAGIATALDGTQGFIAGQVWLSTEADAFAATLATMISDVGKAETEVLADFDTTISMQPDEVHPHTWQATF